MAGPTDAEIEAKLAANMAKAKSYAGDGMQATEQSIQDLIALSKHEARKSASAFGYRLAKQIPPEH